jgi:5-methylthioadenosine/S-adenosylhomocysteine deaminase
LGTDGPASNDTQDLFETLKTAVMMARATAGDPTVLPPTTALRLATGNRVLTPGAPADVVVVNLDHARAAPVHELTSTLVLSTHGPDVDTVIVDGQLLLHHAQVCVLDEPALRDACRTAAAGLRARAL